MAQVEAVRGNVIFVNFGRSGPIMLTKKQLAKTLGRSVRWIEMRQKDGLPSEMRGNRRMYDLTAVEEWITRQKEAKVG